MGAYNVSVLIDNEGTFVLVPQMDAIVEVPLTTITFHCPNQTLAPIANAPDNMIYRVEVREPAVAAPNSLQVEQYAVEDQEVTDTDTSA